MELPILWRYIEDILSGQLYETEGINDYDGEMCGELTVEVDDGLGSLIGYSTTLVDWEAFAGQLEQRCPGESGGSVHDERYDDVRSSESILYTRESVWYEARDNGKADRAILMETGVVGDIFMTKRLTEAAVELEPRGLRWNTAMTSLG